MPLRQKLNNFFTKLLKRYVLNDSATCKHEWTVYSTATAQVCLELYCNNCAICGAVFEPTAEEWSQAFHAPSKPYRWHDNDRVTVGTTRMI